MTTYRVADGEREVILPMGIARTPGGDNARYTSGQTFQVNTDNPEVAPLMRYIRRLLASGDLVEETEAPPVKPAPTQAPPPESAPEGVPPTPTPTPPTEQEPTKEGGSS